MDFRAAPSRGGWIGMGLVGGLGLAELGLVAAIALAGPGPRSAIMALTAMALVPVLIMACYWTWGYFSLRYTVTRDGVMIRWATVQQVIPMPDITHILNGRPYAAALRGWRWPGYVLGHTELLDDEGVPHPMLVYATTPPEGQLAILTPGLAYAISPDDRAAFIEAFKSRRRLGPVQALDQTTLPHRWAQLTLWADPLVLRLIAAGIILNALVLAWITWHYPQLPQQLALRFDYDPVERISTQGPLQPLGGIWQLPLVGLAILLVNTVLAGWVHRHARLAALLLVTGAVLVQVVLLIVLRRIA
jgi:hypothetical protein